MAKQTEVKVIEAKMVVVDGKQVPCTVYSAPKTRSQTKMKTRGKQTSNFTIVGRWSRGV